MEAFNWNTYNSEEHQANDFKALPAGWYPVAIVKAEMRDSSKGGRFLALETEVIEGKFKGRKAFANLNLINASETTVDIAKRDLASICRAVGILHPKSEGELVNKPLLAKLVVKPETEQFPEKNEIKGWEPYTATKKETPAPAAAGPAKKPWE